MNGLQVFSFVNVVEGHIVDDKSVEMKFFVFIYRVLDGVDGAGCGLLLAVECTKGPLHLESFLNESDDVLWFLFPGQLLFLRTKAAAK